MTHTRFFATSIVGGLLARRSGSTWIHVEHGSSFVQSGSRFVRWCARFWDVTIGRIVLGRADAVLAVSGEAAHFVRSLSGRVPDVVRRGFDLPDAVSAGPERSRIRVGYVGRLIDGKGVADLLDAFARMESAAELSIVGDGPDRLRLENRAKRLGIEHVQFHGAVPPEDVGQLLAELDVFVNPSHSEGLPTTVAEAAACGVAIVATDVGGTGEIVRNDETGLLVPAHDIDGLARAIDTLAVDPPRRRRLGNAARTLIQDEFSWTRCRDGLVRTMQSERARRRA